MRKSNRFFFASWKKKDFTLKQIQKQQQQQKQKSFISVGNK